MYDESAHDATVSATTAAAPSINPASLSIDDMERLLSAARGLRITPEKVQADIDAGVPVGANGRRYLVHYAAWLLREVQA